MSKKMYKLAIIDDGVNINRYNIGELEHNVEITYNLEIKEAACKDSFKPSHGTTCAAIIKKISPKAKLSSIKILNNDTHKATISQLVKAIEWCEDKKINIVNISLGTICYKDFNLIRKVINHAARNGVIIVAAGNNEVGYTYPASLSNVIGVKCDKNSSIVLKECEYLYNLYPCDGIEVIAHSLEGIVNYKGEIKEILKCNSFATPFISATVHNIMCQYKVENIVDIKRKLIERSVNFNINMNNYFFSKNIDWLDTAIIFSINENQESAIFSNYNIIEKISLNGTEIYEILNEIVSYIDFNRVKLQKSDTLILLICKCNIRKSEKEIFAFINYLDEIGKNFILIDDLEGELNLNKINKQLKIKVWNAALYKNINCITVNSKKSPLIVIYDFTGYLSEIVAVKLKDLFGQEGYYCIVGTSESKGIIYGLEYVPINKIGLITNNIYNEDIYVYCVNGLKHLENINLEIDIKIIIKNEENNEEYNFYIKSQEKTIVIKEKIEVISIKFIRKVTSALYKNILELF